jgi:hypothetical protein
VVFSLFFGVSYLITDVQILQDSSGSSHSHQRLSYGSQQGKIKLNQISSGPFSLSNGFGCLFVGKVDALFIFPGVVFTYVMMLRRRMRGAKLSMSTYGGNWLSSSVEFSCPFFSSSHPPAIYSQFRASAFPIEHFFLFLPWAEESDGVVEGYSVSSRLLHFVFGMKDPGIWRLWRDHPVPIFQKTFLQLLLFIFLFQSGELEGKKKKKQWINCLSVVRIHQVFFCVVDKKQTGILWNLQVFQVHSNSSSLLFIRKNIPLQLLLLIFPPYFSNLWLIFDVTHDRHRPL